MAIEFVLTLGGIFRIVQDVFSSFLCMFVHILVAWRLVTCKK